MSYKPLHHKYRPQTFQDLVGQKTIALTLSNAIERAKIAPAYLFTGPRGTGKTSSARILAKSLNCLDSDKPTPHPCGRCEVCLAIARGTALDVMEIDAASNTGVDNIREIIERCRFAPVQCRYKVYAIDECHMLSTAAFNALLKTLEEPPPNVVFILATTDPQRVLSTIISRCQRFDYRRIPLGEMVQHLRYIATEENIAIADDAITLVAQIANGGLRDAESLLDQLSLLPETITVAEVWDLVGAVPELDLLKLLKAIKRKHTPEIIQHCRSLLDRGREPLVVLQNLAGFYLNLLIAKTAPNNSEMVAVTENCWQELCAEATNWQVEEILRGQQHLKTAETQLKQTTQPRLWLEITLLGLSSSAAGVESITPNILKATSDRPTATAEPKPQSNFVAAIDSTREINANKQQKVKAQTNGAEVKPASKQEVSLIEGDSNRERHLVQFKSLNTNQTNGKNNASKPITLEPSSSNEPTSVDAPNENEVGYNRDAVDEIWKKIIECLQPPTTQALLRQQCHLISLEGSRAIVGIGSAKLQRLHQGKVTNIETAFAKVCQRIIKVKLEVATPQKPPRESVPRSLSSPPPQPKTELSSETKPSWENETNLPISNQIVKSDRPIEPSVSLDTASFKPPKSNRSTTTDLISSPPRDTTIATSALDASESESPPKPKTVLSPTNSLDVEDSDLERAIADLTHSFEGELVQLDNLNLPEPDANSQADSASDIDDLDKQYSLAPSNNIVIKRQELDSYDEDEDVPF